MTVLEDLAPPPKSRSGWPAIAALEGLPTPRSCPATGSPATAACTATRAYLTAARTAVAEADGLNRHLITAFPATGGITMQRQQNYFLYPGNR